MMKKYFIKLGTHEYKFRVKESGDYGHLVEVILDNESLEFLKSQAYRIVGSEEHAPDPMEKEVEEKVVVNISVDPEKAEIKEGTPREVEERKPELTEKQIEDIKNIKSKMKLTSNDELDPFINEWTLGQQKSYKYLNENNINSFVEFMIEQYLS